MDVILKCRKFDIVRRQVIDDAGKPHSFEYVRHPGAVVVLPALPGDRIVMIRNFRHAIDQTLLELPAGTLDREGEDPLDAAHRELEEETGYRAGRMTELCRFFPSPGFMSELLTAYVATDLSKTVQRLEPTERIIVEEMSAEAALREVRSGGIVDAKTLIVLMRWAMDRGQRA